MKAFWEYFIYLFDIFLLNILQNGVKFGRSLECKDFESFFSTLGSKTENLILIGHFMHRSYFC